jgi:antirestriction protein ArdC
MQSAPEIGFDQLLSSSLSKDTDATKVDAPEVDLSKTKPKPYSAKKSTTSNQDAKEKVLSALLEKIKDGKTPWRKPFKEGFNFAGAFVPRNPASKRIYTGINAIILKLNQELSGYEDPRWMTYIQAQKLGGQVRKGESGVPILVPFKRVKKEKDKLTGEETVTGGYVTFSAKTVFNVSQIDGLDLPSPKDEAGDSKTPLEAQDFIVERYTKSMAAKGLEAPKINYTYVGSYGGHSSSPNWRPSSDEITLPTKEQFNSPEEMFDTLAHELAHSTGHPNRLDRSELTKNYSSDNAARGKEELIAEISSAILSSMFGVNSNIDNTAAYVKSWLGALKDDPNMVVGAASDAQRVVDYILGMDLGDWSPIDGYSVGPESSKEDDQAPGAVAQAPANLDLKFESSLDSIDNIGTSVSGKKYDLSALKNKKTTQDEDTDGVKDLKAIARKTRTAYKNASLDDMREKPMDVKYTPGMKGAKNDDRLFIAVKPTTAAAKLKNTVVDSGKAVLARAAEIYGNKLEKIEKMPDTEESSAPNIYVIKGQLEALTQYRIYGTTFTSEALGGGSTYWNDKDNDKYIKESKDFGGDYWEEEAKYKERAKSWLKERGLSYSKLRQAGITETKLNSVIARQIIAKKIQINEKNADGSYLIGEDGAVVQTVIDNPHNAFWNENITLGGEGSERKISRVDYLVNTFKEISDKYDELVARKNNKLTDLAKNKEVLLRNAERDSIVEAMKEAGVEFDSISLEQFGNRIVYAPQGEDGVPNPIASKKSEAYRSITEAFNFIPKKVLEDLLKVLEKKPIRIKTGVARGHFSDSYRNFYEIVLSAAPGISQEAYTDTAIHEFFHLMQRLDSKMRTLEHAWLYDRLKIIDENGQENLPAPLAIKSNRSGFRQLKPGESSSDTEIFVPGPTVGYYTSKVYNRISDRVTLSPYDSASEVMSTGVQMFTDPKKFTVGSYKIAVVKSGKSIKLFKNGELAYFNPADGQWYKDSAFSIKIPSNLILTQMGYDGVDEDFKSFVVGTLIGMS